MINHADQVSVSHKAFQHNWDLLWGHATIKIHVSETLIRVFLRLVQYFTLKAVFVLSFISDLRSQPADINPRACWECPHQSHNETLHFSLRCNKTLIYLSIWFVHYQTVNKISRSWFSFTSYDCIVHLHCSIFPSFVVYCWRNYPANQCVFGRGWFNWLLHFYFVFFFLHLNCCQAALLPFLMY